MQMQCPKCGESVSIFHRFCPYCGNPVKCENPEEYGLYKIDSETASKLKPVSEAEWSRFVLRALISYHERITMGNHPDLDCWKRGLEYAVSCVEEKIPK